MIAGPGPLERSACAPGLYVHVPFCDRVCPYCDFAVRTGGPARRARWVAALLSEIDLVAAAEPWAAFDTVYFGGGTPSLLEAEQLGSVLDRLRARFTLATGRRLFLEANPEDATPDKLRDLRALGVETLSLGLQALDDARLGFLGRTHSASHGRHAVELALAAGFPTVSIDLIYGLPGESPDQLRREIAEATTLGAHHISAYQLSMPEGTQFGKRLRRGDLHELDQADQADAFVRVHEFLAGAGYTAYEVSNFARSPAHRSRHNQKYWNHTSYLGLGPGAHSFDGRSRRWWNERTADAYEARLALRERPIAGEESLSRRDLALEALMLGLRTADGVDLARCDLSAVPLLVEEGLVTVHDIGIRCTLRGWAVADALAARLCPPESPGVPASKRNPLAMQIPG